MEANDFGGRMGSQGLLIVLASAMAAGVIGLALLCSRLRSRAQGLESASARQERALGALARMAGEAAATPREAAGSAVAALKGLGLQDGSFLVHDEPTDRWVDRAADPLTQACVEERAAGLAERCWERQEAVTAGDFQALAGQLVACPVPCEGGVRAVLMASRGDRAVDRADLAAVEAAAGLLGSVRAPLIGPPNDRDSPEPRASGHVDSLTGLGTPSWFVDALEARCHAQGAPPIALLLVAVDHMDEVAAELGWRAGEEVVRIAARRLQRCVRPDDLLARLEASVFGLLLSDATDPEGAATVGGRALTALASPVAVTGGEVRVAGRAGLVWDASGRADAAALLPEARATLARAGSDVASVLRFGEAQAADRGQRP